MDRNSFLRPSRVGKDVALRKESVDRNVHCDTLSALTPKQSLSARRAWIEIVLWRRFDFFGWLSLSARRAWIEMTRPSDSDVDSAVALRKESVDRNTVIKLLYMTS